MDHNDARHYAERLTRSGIITIPKPVRPHGPMAAVWGVQVTAYPESRVYSHRDSFPPQWRHVLDTACIECGTTDNTAPNLNMATGVNEMWCAPCFYGDVA